ncbi:formimidoylglutamate deiminase [Rubrivivax albus]|uniref:Formimidoylglutamate deiminase n=1 Tax=Rubrivivax albus TaxID=2499835 RepID=A0A3S2WWZ2_9BURK|nr:formimidoylglutamate deiminase [Rubrivivax albus]RVT53734.1 formimidoylglutamate deiminase [Rubrivivax albus]
MTTLWAPRAWVAGAWAEQVLLHIGADGRWADVAVGVPAPDGAEVLPGPVLPGLVNAHSHAFQRAFAGLAERREGEHDDFWSWRDRMYRVALAISPEQLRAVAALLYRELLRGGYTQVCEFHYLQHQPDGQPYADPATLGWALADAAAEAGIGLTLLPVLYERAGFAQPALRDDQRRFRTDADAVHALARRFADARRPNVNAGVAVHSLRAAAPASIHRLRALAADLDGPIHIHVAEQTAEVDDCLAATGRRPMQWLADEGLLDARWQLVHATHGVPAEIDAVAATGAGAVICPTTEANLGDGVPDLPRWLAAGVPMAIGSDSHVGRDWREELRWLDYAQRLVRRQRNVAATPAQPATAARLFDAALAGGAKAAGFARWGLVPGARADLLLPDPADPVSAGLPPGQLLDATVFSGPARPFARTLVAGRWVADDDAALHARGTAALQALHGGPR